MKDKKIYLVIFDKNNYLGTTFDREQALEILKNFLTTNPQVKSEQVIIEEYNYKNSIKIIDVNE